MPPAELAAADPLTPLAAHERETAIETVERRLPPSARVSVYLYQPIAAPGPRPASPGVLWDVGPLPTGAADAPRGLLYQCAEAGRTGSFLQSAAECTRRVPQTSCIDQAAFRSYRTRNDVEASRRAQIAVEQARHSFRTRAADGPPQGYFIHHLALAPSLQSFTSLASGRLPVLGTIFTVTEDETPRALHEYSNLVDYAIFLAGELLEVRIDHLLGRGLVSASFEGSALEELLEAPTSDAAVQLIVKLLFAHHWFFPYDAVAHALLLHGTGSRERAAALYQQHGWLPPRTALAPERTPAATRQLLVADLATLIGHTCWYRLGREFRPRPGVLEEHIGIALNTALLLLCGARCEIQAFAPRHASRRRNDRSVFLGPTAALPPSGLNARLLAPVFPVASLHQLARQHRTGTLPPAERFGASIAVCGPGNTTGHTRTHLKPSQFIEGFEPGGSPRFSTRTQNGMREQTRWLCSYAIGRLVGLDPEPA